MHFFNLALLAKQGWCLLTQPDSIIAKLLKAKYFPHCSFLEAKLKGGESYSWRSIISGRDVFKLGLRYQVGSGCNISVWNDPCVPTPHSFRPYSPIMEGMEDLVVSDLIDFDSKTWATDFMKELFIEGEVERMASIPLSIRGGGDQLIWHYDKKGMYQVRKGYHVYNAAMSHKNRASTSSDEAGANIVPTKEVLWQRRVNLVDHHCMFCMEELETGMHLFKSCYALHGFWFLGPLRVHAKAHPANCLRDWVLDMMDSLTVDQCDFFFMSLWAIWTERNNLIWKGASFQPMNMIQWTSKLLEDFQKYHPKTVRKQRRPQTKWKNPPSGRLKINVDGAFRAEDGSGGIGVVVRNETGMGIAALAKPFLHAHSILNMETEACRAGLLLGIHQG
ncbi:uncharacterized protein LOC112203217 [Rosa chinensis]|uniref:uncharacterized protein LOC112203217 n=1 Tax=Rosa chinensis TaxID=74649 RepID=UPI000D096242|nr:uncharacterized protein LOC112203217 [Rosa chinensis]